MAIRKDLGAATAYALAVEGGYSGTQEQYEVLLASYGTVAQQVEQYKEDAEAFAVGTRNGTAVESTDPAYHNNAAYYATETTDAASTATQAKQDALDAKTDAVTAKNDAVQAKTDAVQAKTDAVQAKTDAVQAKTDAVDAKNDAVSAKTDAQTAKTAAETAQGKAETAQGKAEDAQAAAETAAASLVIDSALSSSSTNPVQNKVINAELSDLKSATTASTIITQAGPSPIAHIADGSANNAKSYDVQITPAQDLHGYDHPWPAGGGKNLLSTEDGTYHTKGSGNLSIVSDITLSAGTYYVGVYRKETTAYSIGIYLQIGSGSASRLDSNSGDQYMVRSFTLNEESTVSLYIYSSSATGQEYRFMLTTSVLTQWQNQFVPYSNICPISGWTGAEVTRTDGQDTPTTSDTYTITFPSAAGTVYGGNLHVNEDGSGTLTVTQILYSNLGDKNWTLEQYDGNNVFSCGSLTGDDGKALNYNYICNKYKAVAKYRSQLSNGEIGVYNSTNGRNRFSICDNSKSTAEAFIESISDLVVCYDLATPRTYTLTAPQIALLLGTNNIWADTGNMAVEYIADTKLYIQTLTGHPDEDMIADANISIGKFFMVGNHLYISTSAIAAGETIVPGTNCTETDLATALNNINA